MLRRHFLSAALAPRVDYRDYSRCLPDYLTALAADAYQRRNRTIAATPLAQRQAWIRETFWSIVGGKPTATPLHTHVTGSFEREGYRVEKLHYQSRPELFIPANLYIPTTGRPPYPGVLFQMGHSKNGKAYPSYQYCCQGLARLGFLVLAFDPMGQGERVAYPDPATGLTRLSSSDDEHTVPGKQLLLTGDTSTRYQAWDAVRSLDVLASHPMADPARLASTGNSGGGTLTMLLAAVDDRLTCAAVACGNTENHACANFNSPGSTDDAEQNLINGGALGIDRWDLLWPFAPKPLLVLASAKDWFGTYSPRYLDNGREEYAKLARAYETAGKKDAIDWYESPLPHGLSHDMRMRIYAWFRRWMQPSLPPVEAEPPVKAEADETLLVRPPKGLTPWSMAKDRARSVSTPAAPRGLASLLAVDPPALARFEKKGEAASRGLTIDAVEVRSAPQVWVPAWIFRPPRAASTIIVLEPGGRNARWGEDDLYQELARTGRTVIAPDLRGVGDMAPEYPRQSARHARWHQDDDSHAWASLMLGKPLLGQRVTDLLAVVAAAGQPVIIAARGSMTVPALFAAALEPRIASVYESGGLASYRSIIEAEVPDHTFANYVPNVLRVTDLPELRASLGSRRRGSGAWRVDELARL